MTVGLPGDCLILMPYGTVQVGPTTVDFDRIYVEIFRPSAVRTGLQPFRADEIEVTPQHDIWDVTNTAILLAPTVLADISVPWGSVWGELGKRLGAHANHPRLRTANGGLALVRGDFALPDQFVHDLGQPVHSYSSKDRESAREAVAKALETRNLSIPAHLGQHAPRAPQI